MDDFHFGVICGILVGLFITDLRWSLAAVEHGYGHWCLDYSFIWQHEECE